MTDGRATSITVRDHPFEPLDPAEPWGRCKHCSSYEATHLHTDAPARNGPDPPYRCPRCVVEGTDPCPHGRPEAPAEHPEEQDPRPSPLPVAEIDYSQMQEHVITPLDEPEEPS